VVFASDLGVRELVFGDAVFVAVIDNINMICWISRIRPYPTDFLHVLNVFVEGGFVVAGDYC
jgi:hypothetical protein